MRPTLPALTAAALALAGAPARGAGTVDYLRQVKAWIDQGAAAPAGEKPEPDPREHWAFHSPVRAPLPASRNAQSTIRNPVDAFLAAEWQKRGLTPQPPADRRLLLRRLYLDLV